VARKLVDAGTPLWSVTFGQQRGEGQGRDAAVVNLAVAETVYLKNMLEVAGRVRLDGLAGREATVVLLAENASGVMEEATRTRVRATGENRVFLDRLWRREVQPVSQQVEALYSELKADERCKHLLESYKEEAIRSLAALEHASLKGLLRRVIGKIFNDVEIHHGTYDVESHHRTYKDLEHHACIHSGTHDPAHHADGYILEHHAFNHSIT
jgi:hypothetical protein